MGIPVTVILDSAAGYYMERVDMVLLGAEGVVESGGIVNKVMVMTEGGFGFGLCVCVCFGGGLGVEGQGAWNWAAVRVCLEEMWAL